MTDRPWTVSRVRRLLAVMPPSVRVHEGPFVAWVEDELGARQGPMRVAPELIGPALVSKLSQHGVQVED